MSVSIRARLDALPWPSLERELDAEGAALVPGLLGADECRGLIGLYEDGERFRSKVVMARHGYGRGEYQYFSYPLPGLVEQLRTELFPRLAPIANRWHEQLGLAPRFPPDHAAFLERCHTAGQPRPTPLLLRYEQGDYNCLHQDLYGEHVFPLQLAVLLSQPGQDFTGGELVFTEQRPRQQSRPLVLTPRRGDAVLFAVRDRPIVGTRGFRRVQMRHGVSRLLSGRRHTLGIIFHDAA